MTGSLLGSGANATRMNVMDRIVIPALYPTPIPMLKH